MTEIAKIVFPNRIAIKMILALLIVILIPTVFISLLFYSSAAKVIKTNVRESSMQIAKQAADSLSNMLDVGSDTSDLVYNDLRIQQAVMKDDAGLTRDEAEENRQYITSMLNNLIYSSSFVKIIYVLKDSGTSWGSGVFAPSKLARYTLSDFPWIREAVRQDGKLVWSPIQYDLFSGAGDNTDLVLPVTRVMKDFNTLKNIGYVMINLDGKAVLDKISQIRLGKTGYFFVTDRSGKVMIHSDESLIGKTVTNPALHAHIAGDAAAEFEYETNGVPFYGVKKTLSNGWYIVGVVPISEVTGQLDAIQSSVVLWALLFSLVAIAVGLFIAGKITKPIGQLTRQMKLVETGDFNARTDIRSSDEIGVLSKQFNRMIYKIEQLMEQVREEQSKKQQAELRAVMHRINPHFLFNTLSTIRWLVKFGQKERAYDGLAALTKLLEANMGKKGHMITLGEELDIIRSYLSILQFRYELQIRLDVSVDAPLLDMKIPRMLIQPLVENAIFHGIVPKGTDGAIRIVGKEEGDAADITVIDDGLGMDAGKLEQISGRSAESANGEQYGIGLRHVYECVSLYFPQGSGVRISSEADRGTAVSLHLMKPAG